MLTDALEKEITFTEIQQGKHFLLVRSEYEKYCRLEDVVHWFSSMDRPEQRTEGEATCPFGRGGTTRFEIPGVGPVYFRRLLRGGFIRHFLTDRCLRSPFGKIEHARPFAELRVLARLLQAQVQVPSPVCAYVQLGDSGILSNVFYRGGVVTHEIVGAKNLLDLASFQRGGEVGKKAFQHLCVLAGKEARKMIQAGISHRDLHLGNVLYSEREGLMLIDFDGAVTLKKEDRERSVTQLRERWARSAKKHNLEDSAVPSFEQGLLSS